MIDTAGLINDMIQFSKKNRWSPSEVAQDATGVLMPYLQKVAGSQGPLVLLPETALASALAAAFHGDKTHEEAARTFAEVFCNWFQGAKSLVGDQLLNIQPNEPALREGLLELTETGDAGNFAQSFGELWGAFIRASKDGAGVPLQ